jgi:cell division protein FtsB
MLDIVLSSIPAWAWLAGAVGALAIYLLSGILSHFPAVGIYAKFIKPVSGLITLVCVFMYGGSGVQAMWEAKVAAAQEKVAEAEAESAEANKKLDAERRKKQQVITQYIDRVKEQIVVQREVIDAKCEVGPESIKILNDAARGAKQ